MLSVRPATAYDGDGAVYWVRRHHLSPWALHEMFIGGRLVSPNYAHRSPRILFAQGSHATWKGAQVEWQET